MRIMSRECGKKWPRTRLRNATLMEICTRNKTIVTNKLSTLEERILQDVSRKCCCCELLAKELREFVVVVCFVVRVHTKLLDKKSSYDPPNHNRTSRRISPRVGIHPPVSMSLVYSWRKISARIAREWAHLYKS